MKIDLQPSQSDEQFIEYEDQITTWVKQLIRAMEANDTTAVELIQFYLEEFLQFTLKQHLKKAGQWNSVERCFWGLSVSRYAFKPHFLRLRGGILLSITDQQVWYREPFEFEILLSPETGLFQQYTFRFADERPLSAKGLNIEIPELSTVRWRFEFHRLRKTATLEPCFDDEFIDTDDWLAAWVRQLFRMMQIQDSSAEKLTMFYLEEFLQLTLYRHLKKDGQWNTNERWFDGLSVSRDLVMPHWLSLNGGIVWATADQQHWYREPFHFEISLCPETGEFLQYTFHFADKRPLSDKGLSSEIPPMETVVWAFEFHRKRKKDAIKRVPLSHSNIPRSLYMTRLILPRL